MLFFVSARNQIQIFLVVSADESATATNRRGPEGCIYVNTLSKHG